MISMDSNILRPGSEVRQRMADYGTLADRLDIIVCCLKNAVSDGERSIADNVRVFPTRSPYKIFYVWDVLRMVKNQIKDKVSVKGAVPDGRQGSSSGWDLVTAQDPFETGLAGWLASLRLRAKLQLQIHTDFLSLYFAKESVKNFIRVRLAKWLLPKADSIRVVSERIKKSLSNVKCQLSKVVVLPIFVDVQKIQSAPITADLRAKYPQFDFILFTASRLTKEKNITMAIKAMSEVTRSHPKVGLIIVGDGPEKNNLRLETRNSKLETNIIFEPWTDDLPSYYKTADAFLQTSNYEGYGRTLIEAAAAGCPIITTDVGAVGEVINKDNSLIIPVGDKIALVDGIHKLKSEPSLRIELGRRAQQAVSALDSRTEYLDNYRQSWLVV